MKQIQPDLHPPQSADPATPQPVAVTSGRLKPALQRILYGTPSSPSKRTDTVMVDPVMASPVTVSDRVRNSPVTPPARAMTSPATPSHRVRTSTLVPSDRATTSPVTPTGRATPIMTSRVTADHLASNSRTDPVIPDPKPPAIGSNNSRPQGSDVPTVPSPATIISDQALKSMFSEDENLYKLGVTLFQLLSTVQKKTDLNHRLHLFIESDKGVAGGVPEGRPGAMHRVEMRLAFSPTLCPSDPQQQSGLSRLYGELTEMSFQRASAGSSYNPNMHNFSAPDTSQKEALHSPIPFQAHYNKPPSRDSNHLLGRELQWPDAIVKEFHLNFPKWCPFSPQNGENGYSHAPQNSKDHHLVLRKDTVEVFKRLKDFQVLWMYQELFLFMHRQGRILERKGKVTGMAKSITYSQFTPPWIRLNLSVKLESPALEYTEIQAFAETVKLKKAGIADLRRERNTQGYRRLTFILAAFYNHEEKAMKPVIDYLLSVVPTTRSQLRKKPKKEKRKTRTENITSGSEFQISDGEGTLRPRKKAKVGTRPASSQNTNNETAAKSIGRTQESSEDVSEPHPTPRPGQSSRNRSESPSCQPVKPINLGPTPPQSPMTDGRSAMELSHKRFLSIAQKKKAADQTSVFKGVRIYDAQPEVENSENDEEILREALKGLPRMNATRTEPSRENCEKDSPSTKDATEPKSSDSPEEPLTPFENDDILDAAGGEESSDDALEKDIFSGPIKCGALGMCHYFTCLEMQDIKHLKKKCLACGVPMHDVCYTLKKKQCDVCSKAKVFGDLYNQEKRWWR